MKSQFNIIDKKCLLNYIIMILVKYYILYLRNALPSVTVASSKLRFKQIARTY